MAIDIAYDKDDPGGDMASRIESARDLLGQSAFVHVHIKATDEAGHTKDPAFKQSVIEAVDTTRFMAFKDDVVIRIRSDKQETVLDLRSVSRVGQGDLGANAKRIRAFLELMGR